MGGGGKEEECRGGKCDERRTIRLKRNDFSSRRNEGSHYVMSAVLGLSHWILMRSLRWQGMPSLFRRQRKFLQVISYNSFLLLMRCWLARQTLSHCDLHVLLRKLRQRSWQMKYRQSRKKWRKHYQHWTLPTKQSRF